GRPPVRALEHARSRRDINDVGIARIYSDGLDAACLGPNTGDRDGLGQTLSEQIWTEARKYCDNVEAQLKARSSIPGRTIRSVLTWFEETHKFSLRDASFSDLFSIK